MKKKNLLILFVLLFFCWTLLINVTSATTSSFIYESNGNITVCDPGDSSACITMMDRNLWATTNDITSDKSYWYHFQWWNNHGFKPWKVNTQNHVEFPNWESMWTSQIDCSSYGPWNPLDSDAFIKWEVDYFNSEFDYCDEHNDNLWWWGDDYYENNRWYDDEIYLVNNVKGRQWPCPEWYHVPSNWEWHTLLEFWTKNYWNWLNLHDAQLVRQINSNYNGSGEAAAAVLQFREDFKVPFAGYRDWYKWYIGWLWQDANFWSSSAYIGYNVVHSFHIGPNSMAAGSTAPYANAYSIRCFKNIPSSINSSKSSIESNSLKSENLVVEDKYNLCDWQRYNSGKIFARLPLEKSNILNSLKCISWNSQK